eukprot:4360825-Heterocapsa_arctica.AAC.1
MRLSPRRFIQVSTHRNNNTAGRHEAAGGQEQLAAACLCEDSAQARQAWASRVRAYTSSLFSYNT